MQSPSARKVWIEIFLQPKTKAQQKSPSARKVWIEIGKISDATHKVAGHLPQGRCGLKFSVSRQERLRTTSPSARKVWIEIIGLYSN